MHCEQAEMLFAQFVFNELDDKRQQKLETHLGGCPACSELVGDLRLSHKLLLEGLENEQAPALAPDRRKALLSRLEADQETLTKPEHHGNIFRDLLTSNRAVKWTSIAALLLVGFVISTITIPSLQRSRRASQGGFDEMIDYDTKEHSHEAAPPLHPATLPYDDIGTLDSIGISGGAGGTLGWRDGGSRSAAAEGDKTKDSKKEDRTFKSKRPAQNQPRNRRYTGGTKAPQAPPPQDQNITDYSNSDTFERSLSRTRTISEERDKIAGYEVYDKTKVRVIASIEKEQTRAGEAPTEEKEPTRPISRKPITYHEQLPKLAQIDPPDAPKSSQGFRSVTGKRIQDEQELGIYERRDLIGQGHEYPGPSAPLAVKGEYTAIVEMEEDTAFRNSSRPEPTKSEAHRALDQLSDSPNMQSALCLLSEGEEALGPITTSNKSKDKGAEQAQTQFIRLSNQEAEALQQKINLAQAQEQSVLAAQMDGLIPDDEGEYAALSENELNAVFETLPVNPFVMAEKDALSTFSIDTDTASYTMARNYIQGGYLPPTASVRMEEFINSFDYNYSQTGKGVFSVYAEAAPSPFRNGLALLKIGIKGKVLGRESIKPAHLSFVVDASGSMAKQDRLPLVQHALKLMASRMDPADKISLVTYGPDARLVLEAVPANQHEIIIQAIDSIQCGGSTNMLEGLSLGYAMAQKAFRANQVNQVILCSDGIANVGQTEADKILQEVKAFRDQGITLTIAGFGRGAYNDVLMEKLSNSGDGHYVFVDSHEEAQRIFAEELASTFQVIARDVKIQVSFDPNRVRRYRLIGYENRDIADEDFRNDAIDAGEVGSGQSVTALYELELINEYGCIYPQDIGTVYVRYHNEDTGKVEEISKRLENNILKARTPETAPRFYLAAAASEFAEILRESEYVDTHLQDVMNILASVTTKLSLDEKVREFYGLTQRAQGLPRIR